jgi:predicted transcriptional regulator
MASSATDPDLFDDVDETAERLADERAEADIKAGRVISHEAMKRWLLSWGTPDEMAPPECGE